MSVSKGGYLNKEEGNRPLFLKRPAQADDECDRLIASTWQMSIGRGHYIAGRCTLTRTSLPVYEMYSITSQPSMI